MMDPRLERLLAIAFCGVFWLGILPAALLIGTGA